MSAQLGSQKYEPSADGFRGAIIVLFSAFQLFNPHLLKATTRHTWTI